MGKAIVLKNTNFATNKLAVVTFGESKPCTSIALNKSTATITAIGGTEQLTATALPVDTTDAVIWSSSNTEIATVDNGLVTALGIGSVTITAVCGTKSDTCTITITNTLQFTYDLQKYNKPAGTGQDYVWRQNGTAPYAALRGTVETTKRIRGDNGLYPIMLGAGATKLNITVPSAVRATVFFTDSKTACDYSITEGGEYVNYAKLISGDASAFDSNVPVGNRVVDIPEGADSVAMSLQYPNGEVTADTIANTVLVVS